MEKKPCIKCNRLIIDGIRFCPFCGAEQRVIRPSSTFERNPFDILQVTPDAEIEVIHAAYKSLAKKYHPDTLKNGTSEERMKELNWAYRELQDPEKRKKWAKKKTGNIHPPKKTKRSETKYPEKESTYQKPPTTPSHNKSQTKEKEKPAGTTRAETTRATTLTQKDERNRNTRILILLGIGIILVVVIAQSLDAANIYTAPQSTQRNSQQSISTRKKLPNIAGWELVFIDGFNSNINNWYLESETYKDYGEWKSSIMSGKLVWSGKSTEGFHTNNFPAPRISPFTDMRISVDVRLIDGDKNSITYGIAFRTSDSGYYNLIISEQNWAVFANYDTKEDIKLIDWTYEPTINNNYVNHLAIIASGNDISFYINEELVGEITDSKFKDGYVGLGFGINKPNTEAVAQFDNLKIWIPQEEPTITPSTTRQPQISGCVTVTSLNVREGPGTNYQVVRSFPLNQCIEISGISEDLTWMKTTEGWLFADYIDLRNASKSELPIILYDGSKYSTNTPSPKNTELIPTNTTVSWTNTPQSSNTPWATNAPSPTTTPTPTMVSPFD